MNGAAARCAAELRKGDEDRYLTATLVPARARAAVFALFALNLELARVRESVSEPLLGEIRLQFWRDSIAEAAAGRARAHPTAQALGELLANGAATADDLVALVDARSVELDDAPFADVAALSAYGRATAGALNELALKAMGVADAPSREAAREAGAGWALAGLMRALPFHAAQRRSFLPAEVVARHGAAVEDVFAGRFTPALGRAVDEVSKTAAAHLDTARAARVERAAWPVLAQGRLARLYLARLRAAGNDPFAADAPGRLARQVTLAVAALTGRY